MITTPNPRPVLPAGYSLHFNETLDSTSDEAKRLVAGGAGEGTTVWALTQSAGRGRQGRHWRSPRGNLYLSFVVRPSGSLAAAAQLSFVAALAVQSLVADLCPDRLDEISLKWPNDILLSGRKLAGILLESVTGPADQSNYVIVGIGLNVAVTPDQTSIPAVDLNLAADPQDLADIVEKMTAAWDREMEVWQRQGFADVRQRWLAHAAYLGQTVTATLAGRPVTGILDGMDEDGALLLALARGEIQRISSGEIGALAQPDRRPSIRIKGS